jgi:hypothetical protein
MGGTGFSPPFLNPKNPPPPFVDDVNVKMDHKVYKVQAKTAGKFLQSMSERWQKPATVFCSRELENGLGEFVKSSLAKGDVPSDEQLRAKAREILGVQETAADDAQLLDKFKALHAIGSGPTNPVDVRQSSVNLSSIPNSCTDIPVGPISDYALPNFTDDVSMLANFDMELGAIDLTTDFGTGTVPVSSGMDLAMDMDLSGVDVGQQSMGKGAGKGIGSPTGMQIGEVMGDEALHDYSELYKVHAATASPLRRRASEKLAAKMGRAGSSRGNMYAG